MIDFGVYPHIFQVALADGHSYYLIQPIIKQFFYNSQIFRHNSPADLARGFIADTVRPNKYRSLT